MMKRMISKRIMMIRATKGALSILSVLLAVFVFLLSPPFVALAEETLTDISEEIVAVEATEAWIEDGIIHYGEHLYSLEEAGVSRDGDILVMPGNAVSGLALADGAVYVVTAEDEEWVEIDSSLRGDILPLFGTEDNERRIFDFARDSLSVNVAAACGILSNIGAESSFKPTAGVIDVNGKTSYGICQWNGSRFEALKAYCEKEGYDYTSLDGQLEYLKTELNGSEKSAFSTVKNVEDTADGAYEAGFNWAKNFERCNSQYHDGRGVKARDVYWPKYAEDETKPESEEDTAKETGAAMTLAVKQKAYVHEVFEGEYESYVATPKNIVTVSKAGLITAKKAGTARVSGRVKKDGAWKEVESMEVEVLAPSFSAKTINASYIGQSFALSDYFDDKGLTGYSVVSSKDSVAVADEGEICAVGKGQAVVRVVFGEGKNAAKYSVNIKVSPALLNKSELSMKTGGTTTLKLKNIKGKPEWKSSDEEGLSVSESGKVKAFHAGDYTVTASFDGRDYECAVRVLAPSISKEQLSLKVGKKATLTVKNTQLKNVSWESSDPEVASVSKGGKVTGIGEGEAVVFAEIGGVRLECEVAVN